MGINSGEWTMDFGQQLLIAFSLMLVLEGVVPFLYPQRWRQLVSRLAEIDDRQLRIAGLVSMLVGVALLYLING
ncbi:DUF2065 domain-containing protein [Endozoicomonas sp. SCSIO W0465]|uniref:DUF2065 domain-containing protein n=1 Tax=Endozoicomonas sp. SCSIO W0465 TaxID=2918516 RepID=UPI0035321998